MEGNELRMHQNARSQLFKNARRLRENPTKPECILWERLKNKQLGYKIRRQHPLGSFILDFYCHQLKLCIEVDGEYHNQDLQILRDEERTNQIIYSGLWLIRFSNYRVVNNVEEVVSEIKHLIEKHLSEKSN